VCSVILQLFVWNVREFGRASKGREAFINMWQTHTA
jgi:hypothetical protein